MLRGKASRSGQLVRQPQSFISESDAACDREAALGARIGREAKYARPDHTGTGGRITTWVWGRGLEPIDGRSKDSLFFAGHNNLVCSPALCLCLHRGGFCAWGKLPSGNANG